MPRASLQKTRLLLTRTSSAHTFHFFFPHLAALTYEHVVIRYAFTCIHGTAGAAGAQTLNGGTLCWNIGPIAACTNTFSYEGTRGNDSPNTPNTDIPRHTPDQFSRFWSRMDERVNDLVLLKRLVDSHGSIPLLKLIMTNFQRGAARSRDRNLSDTLNFPVGSSSQHAQRGRNIRRTVAKSHMVSGDTRMSVLLYIYRFTKGRSSNHAVYAGLRWKILCNLYLRSREIGRESYRRN